MQNLIHMQSSVLLGDKKLMHDQNTIYDDNIRLNGYSEVLLIVGMHEHVKTSSKNVSSQCDIKY